MSFLVANELGFFCPQGDFYIDPRRAVARALITHAHADHARPGSDAYLCAAPGRDVLALRVGGRARIETLPYGQARLINGIRVSFHPAGHLLGSAQIRLEHRGEVWVVSGDYKTHADPTCAMFEPVPCHVFVTESTFGLPVYRWAPPGEIVSEINQWWQRNQTQKRTSAIYAYALGKAQRILHGLDPRIGPILIHESIDRFLGAYAQAGVRLPKTELATSDAIKAAHGRALVLLPPATARVSWLHRTGNIATGFASGWMQIRGARHRRGVDQGFVLSDHADWGGLLSAIHATGAERILVTHGYAQVLVRWLRELRRRADPLPGPFDNANSDDTFAVSQTS